MLKLQTLPTQRSPSAREHRGALARRPSRCPAPADRPLVARPVGGRLEAHDAAVLPRRVHLCGARPLDSRTATTRFAATLAHFPAILEPLLAAPLWRFFSIETAYHLVQAENAVAASLVGDPRLPARPLARARPRLQLSLRRLRPVDPGDRQARLRELTDLVAYPLVLAARRCRQSAPSTRRRRSGRSRSSPSRRSPRSPARSTSCSCLRTSWPRCSSSAARMFRPHKVRGARAAPGRGRNHGRDARLLLGRFARTTHREREFFKWFVLQVVPAQRSPQASRSCPGRSSRSSGRRPAAKVVFSLLVGAFMVLLFCESAVYSANSADFKERYLFTVDAAARARVRRLPEARPPASVGRRRCRRRAGDGRVTPAPVSAYAISAQTGSTPSSSTASSWLEGSLSYGSTRYSLAVIITVVPPGRSPSGRLQGRPRGLALRRFAIVAGRRHHGGARRAISGSRTPCGASTCRPTPQWIEHAAGGKAGDRDRDTVLLGLGARCSRSTGTRRSTAC